MVVDRVSRWITDVWWQDHQGVCTEVCEQFRLFDGNGGRLGSDRDDRWDAALVAGGDDLFSHRFSLGVGEFVELAGKAKQGERVTVVLDERRTEIFETIVINVTIVCKWCIHYRADATEFCICHFSF